MMHFYFQIIKAAFSYNCQKLLTPGNLLTQYNTNTFVHIFTSVDSNILT